MHGEATDPDTVFADLQTLEADLAQSSAQLARHLADSPSDVRTANIKSVAAPLFRQQARYGQLVQALRSTVHLSQNLPPQDAAARNDLLRHGTQRLGIWPSVEAMVARQTRASSFAPLVTQSPELHSRMPSGVTNVIMQALFDLSNPDALAQARQADQSYADIPLAGAYFVELLQAAQRLLLAQGHTGPMRFLDMGCGGGSKVLAATGAFEDVRGADFNPAYIKAAKAFLTRLGRSPDLVEQADALTYDEYGAFDVIYFFRPLKDPDLVAQLEARVQDQARPGAVIIAPLNMTLGRDQTRACRIEDPLFVAGISPKDARALRERATGLGAEHRPGTTHDAAALGFWAPVVLQSQRNGFALL